MTVEILTSESTRVDMWTKGMDDVVLNSSFRLSFTRNIRLLCYAPFPTTGSSSTKHDGTS
jgi:hypothetical protein